MKKKITTILVVLILATTGSTCKKKISKYPFDLYGVWYSEDFFCGTVLILQKNGEGKLFTDNDGFCSITTDAKGKVKYKKDVLYIGKKKYTIFDEPKTVSGNDSIEAPDENNFSSSNRKMRKVLATMKLQEKGIFTFQESYTFSKYVNY